MPTSQKNGEDISPPPNLAVKLQEQRHQSVYSGLETGGRALVEVLPLVVFRETGKQDDILIYGIGDSDEEATAIMIKIDRTS